MEITGKLIAALPTRSGVSQKSGNPWQSREYVMETPGQYPKKMCFTVFGEERLKQFALHRGDEVTVKFDIDAHEYNGRWYNTITAYDVVRLNPQPTTTQTQQAVVQQQAAPAPFPPPQQQNNGGETDNLPF